MSSRWFCTNCTLAVQSAELNSYGMFQPRGPNLRRSCKDNTSKGLLIHNFNLGMSMSTAHLHTSTLAWVLALFTFILQSLSQVWALFTLVCGPTCWPWCYWWFETMWPVLPQTHATLPVNISSLWCSASSIIPILCLKHSQFLSRG